MRTAFALAVPGFFLVAAGILIITTGHRGTGPSLQFVLAMAGVACLVLAAARALGVALGAYVERRPCAGALTFGLLVGGIAAWLLGLFVPMPVVVSGSPRSWLDLVSLPFVLAIAMLAMGVVIGIVGSMRALERWR